LASPHYIFEGIHGSEIEIVIVCPRVTLNLILHHSLLGVLVVRGDGECILVDPLPHQLLVWLSNDEIILVGSQVHPLSVGFGIICPGEGLSVVRVEEHQYLRQLSVSIEDELRWILGNVEDPVE
jgi:hypothetical protein